MTGQTRSQTRRPCIVVVGDREQALRRLANWEAVDALADVRVCSKPLRGKELVEALAPADVLVLVRDRTPLDEALISKLPNLRYVIFTGTRNTTIDLAGLAKRAIPVSHTGWGPSKDSTCEMTWALILAATRQLEKHTALLRAGQWRPNESSQLANVLHGKTLGLIGLGEIGSRVATVGRAFGMEVLTWSPNMNAQRAADHGASFVSLEELLSQSAVVSLHVVPSNATRHLLNAERLALMQPDSLLINTSRAALIDTEALVHALKSGRPGFVGLDVFEQEPLPADHALLGLPNAILTPHLGFVTEPVFSRFALDVVECLDAWLTGQPLIRQL